MFALKFCLATIVYLGSNPATWEGREVSSVYPIDVFTLSLWTARKVIPTWFTATAGDLQLLFTFLHNTEVG